MTTKEHPHAEVLRAIADGVPLSEFEARWNRMQTSKWQNVGCSGLREWFFGESAEWEVRRKPQYIMVNGFKVPKPLDVMPGSGDVFFVDPTSGRRDEEICSMMSIMSVTARIAVDRKIAHATHEAAIAHAKAMLGIDPEYFK